MVSHEFSFLGAKKTLFTTLQSAVHPWQHELVSKAFGKRVGRQHDWFAWRETIRTLAIRNRASVFWRWSSCMSKQSRTRDSGCASRKLIEHRPRFERVRLPVRPRCQQPLALVIAGHGVSRLERYFNVRGGALVMPLCGRRVAEDCHNTARTSRKAPFRNCEAPRAPPLHFSEHVDCHVITRLTSHTPPRATAGLSLDHTRSCARRRMRARC